ncbi:hypothetical protein Q7P37_000914 [Cladosporium fusiforme]
MEDIPAPPAFYGQSKPQKKQVCRFFKSKGGCRAGDACPYAHPSAQDEQSARQKPARQTSKKQAAPANQPQRQYQPPPVDDGKVVRPKPHVDNPRAFQVGQITRRFKTEVSDSDDGSTYTFKMSPSDPDFPYEIEALECMLSVPNGYPSSSPTLRVLNKDIPRGFQINVERGFGLIRASAPEATLLGLMNRLDKQLESILSGEMAETVKLVVHKNAPTPTPKAEPASAAPENSAPAHTPRMVVPIFSSQDKEEAKAKRQTNTRQLEARLGRLSSFAKSPDGFSYTLPLDSPKRSTWPSDLQLIRSFTLLLPELYPLEPSTILLDSDSKAARNVEEAFKARSVAGADATLMQQINYLTIHVKDMAVDTAQDKEIAPPVPVESNTSAGVSVVDHAPQPAEQTSDSMDDRSHIKIIPRPPEWDVGHSDGDSAPSDTDDYSYDSGDDTEDSAKVDEEAHPAGAPVERGVLLSFPQLELHSIELMELTTLNLSIKCERCKDTMDVERLRNNVSGDAANMRDESCKKCANGMAVGFRADLMHSGSVRAGYLDLDGCTVVDMLPSNFIPTCSECSTPHPAPGVVSVRGESTMAMCRECHKRMTFKIPEIKFLRVSAAAIRASKAPGRKKPKENLGIVAGTELPRRGRCTHYGKSYRWFRCHDAATDHPNEHANRMIWYVLEAAPDYIRTRLPCIRSPSPQPLCPMAVGGTTLHEARLADVHAHLLHASLHISRQSLEACPQLCITHTIMSHEAPVGLMQRSCGCSHPKCSAMHLPSFISSFVSTLQRGNNTLTYLPAASVSYPIQMNPRTNDNLPCDPCSREQNYRPEECGICQAGLVGKKGHGFWEGGKGTRDKTRMSRKDPRKFKRLPGGAARKKTTS